MNVHNKQHSIFLDFKTAAVLKQIGFPQNDFAAYWCKSDKKLYLASSLFRGKDFERLYLAAPGDAEINSFLPGSMDSYILHIVKKSENHYEACYKLQDKLLTQNYFGVSEIEAKAKLLKYCISKKLIKL